MDKFEITPLIDAFVEKGDKCFSTEASDLGLTSFPKTLIYEGVEYTDAKAQRDAEGELYAVEYRNGQTTFTLWND